MIENIIINRHDYTDLNMYHCGMESCAPGHHFGPAVRDHYLIHYIFDGKGYFEMGDKVYHLSKGQGFFIPPDVITFYRADKNEPWEYAWVGFQGQKAKEYLVQADITIDNPIFTYDQDDYIKNCFLQMINSRELGNGREVRLLGLLHLFLSQLIETADKSASSLMAENRQRLYINKAIDFIEMNFSRRITVAEISNYIALDRSYLYSLFKEYLGVSPQEYLINFRVTKACLLMKNEKLSIADISRSVGYDDPLLFSKTFKRIKKISPREYRKGII